MFGVVGLGEVAEGFFFFEGLGEGDFQADGPFDDLDELADVAGPVVAAQEFQVGGFELGLVAFLLEAGEALGHDRLDVLEVVAEGRDVYLQRGKAVVKVGPELAGADEAGQFAVGGGDDADIHTALRAVGAFGCDLAVFDHPQ